MRLENKIALITGAAAALKDGTMGFGGAAAWAFVHEGARVVLADINDELGERSAASLRDAGHTAEYVHLDVTRASDWEDASRDRFSCDSLYWSRGTVHALSSSYSLRVALKAWRVSRSSASKEASRR